MQYIGHGKNAHIASCIIALLEFFRELAEGEVRGFVALLRFPGRICLDLWPKALRLLSTTALRSVDFCQGAIQ